MQETRSTVAARYLWALRIAAVLQTAALAWEFFTAGRLVSADMTVLPLHSWGAIGLHIASGIQVLAAVALWRPGGGPLWPAVVSAVAFALSFLQASFGSSGNLAAHVPLALTLVVLVVWVLSWSWTRRTT
ncbi:hypothetical protein CLV63_11048 [Murinocardiopsis flavida]|uniref:Uncharacterized protein n=1 Tax=Murinocardiopsis flavida TaxID=645275 RepID=A0A2P8DHR5_9ACTN|nr:hypothetical protein [Murinocardiopsis flavida]PSK96751.1 hypothetical protein CLV63_11048 [Murinocardiopsis flavida]